MHWIQNVINESFMKSYLLIFFLITCFISCSQGENQSIKIVDVPYNEVYGFSEGMSRVKKGGKYGFVDATSGKEVISCKYDEAANFSDGLAWVSRPGFYGFVNKSGEEVLPCDYKVYDSTSGGRGFFYGRALVEFEGMKGFIDKKGNLVTQFTYSHAFPFHEGFAWVEDENRWTVIDTTGRRIANWIRGHPLNFRDGISKIMTESYDGKWYFKYVNTVGKTVYPRSPLWMTEENSWTQYEPADYFSEGRGQISGPGGKQGYIDTNGVEIIPCQYVYASNFSEGLAAVEIMSSSKRVTGYINDLGETVIPFQYDYAESFSEGLAKVGRDGFHGFINKDGEEVLPCKYDDTGYFSNGLASMRNERYKYGFIDKSGKVVIPFNYDEVTDFHDGAAWLRSKDKWKLAIINIH